MPQQTVVAVGKLLRVALGVALVILLLYAVDFRSLLAAFSDISLGDLALLALIAAILIFVSVLKWRIFLARLGITASVVHLYRLYLVGYFVNLIMPSYVGGDLVRSLYVGAHVDRAHSVSATLLERYTGFVAMVLMALIALPLSQGVTYEIGAAVVLTAVAAAIGSAAVFTRRASWLARSLRLPVKWVVMAERIESGLVWGASDPILMLRAFGLSFVFHVMTIVNTVAVSRAVGWEGAPWGELFVVVPLILLIGAVPVSPQGLGIQEGAFVFFLQAAGATSAQALAVALVLRAKSYLLALLGGLLWLGVRHDRPQAATTTSS